MKYFWQATTLLLEFQLPSTFAVPESCVPGMLIAESRRVSGSRLIQLAYLSFPPASIAASRFSTWMRQRKA